MLKCLPFLFPVLPLKKFVLNTFYFLKMKRQLLIQVVLTYFSKIEHMYLSEVHL